jgi:hypothetical protein
MNEYDYKTIIEDPLLLGPLLMTCTVSVPKGRSSIPFPHDPDLAVHNFRYPNVVTLSELKLDGFCVDSCYPSLNPFSTIQLIGDAHVLPGVAHGVLSLECTEACQCQYDIYTLQSKTGLIWFQQNGHSCDNRPPGVTVVDCPFNWMISELRCHIDDMLVNEILFDPSDEDPRPMTPLGNGWWILRFYDDGGLNFTRLKSPCLRYTATQHHKVEIFILNWNYMTVSNDGISIAYHG